MENRDHAVRGTVLQAELRSPRFAARIEGDLSARAGVVLIHPRLQYIHRVLLHRPSPPLSVSRRSESSQDHGRPATRLRQARADLPTIAIDYFYCMGRKPCRIMIGSPIPTSIVCFPPIDHPKEGYPRLLGCGYRLIAEHRRCEENTNLGARACEARP